MIANEGKAVQISSHGIPGEENSVFKTMITQNRNDVATLISGTYCHPDLIPHIACWILPEFALMAPPIVQGDIPTGHKACLASAKQELDAKQLELEQATELRGAARVMTNCDDLAVR